MTNVELAALLGFVGAALGAVAWYAGAHPRWRTNARSSLAQVIKAADDETRLSESLRWFLQDLGVLIGSVVPLKK